MARTCGRSGPRRNWGTGIAATENTAECSSAAIEPRARASRTLEGTGNRIVVRLDAQFAIAENESGDSSLIGRVIRTGESVLCENIEQSAHVIDRPDLLISAGICTVACIPLSVGWHSRWVRSWFGARGTEPLGPDQMVLLAELRADESFALQYLNKHEEVAFLSYFEPLTGLPRRKLFCERLDRLLARNRGGGSFVVIVLDITHLAVVNDSFGRHTGDRLLQVVAERIKEQFCGSELLADLGGGSFLCVHALGARGNSELS